MNVSENAEEVLENLWVQTQEGGESTCNYINMDSEEKKKAENELIKLDYISVTNNQLSLTKKGLKEAENVIRRHRLAERLLVDILDADLGLVEEAACKLEHAIKKGIDDNVCILLGHPRVCPHGKPIPMGECCKKGSKKTSKVVAPLCELKTDQEGKIAYIHSTGKERLQKLMAMGITPGMRIRVIQRFPSHVFQIENAQIAVDEEIASEIFVVTNSSNYV